MLRHLSEAIIVPTYAAFAEQADTLAARTEALRTQPSSETLAAAAAAWRAASTTWKETEAFELGPVRAQRIDSRIDFWSTRPRTIEEALADEGMLDPETVEQLSVAARGLPALEYLLFDTTGTGRPDAALLRDDRRRAFAAALARDVADNARILLAAWRPEDEAFAATWGQEDDPMDGPQEAITMLANRAVFLLEEIRRDKLGAPLGKDNGGTPDPHAAEAWRSGISRAQILHNLLSFRRVYHGRMGDAQGEIPPAEEEAGRGGLKTYLETVDASLADTIDVQIERTRRVVEAIPKPLHTAVTDAPVPVERAYAEVGRLLQLVEVDMMNVLGITLFFNDNDGD